MSIPSSYSQVKQRSIKMGDGPRVNYSIYLPGKYKKKDSLTLIIALHWGWRSNELPENFSKTFMESFVIPIFKDNNTILLAPNCPGSSWVDDQSLSAVLKLRKFSLEKYNINPSNIIITGFSLGGIGTWYLATHYPGLFTCAIPIAGYPKKEWLELADPIKIMAVNSADDEVIPVDQTRTAVEYLKSKNIDISLLELNEVSHYNINLFIEPVKRFYLTNK
jgi:predicted peptidase